MKGIWSKIYLGLGILGLLFPMQVKAAQQDTVTLQQEQSRVAVSVGISNAKEEKISTISVSLNVNVDGLSQALVTFDFDSGLEGTTEHDFIYNEDTGKMDIYVSSLRNQSLFGDGELKLGCVRAEPADSSQVIQVEVRYLENSFQAANASYGSKTPVILSLPDPVSLQVGAGVSYDTPGSDGGSASGGGGSGTSGQSVGVSENSGQGTSFGSDNMNQGLYDESTRFVNNPADAQIISSGVVKESNIHPSLVDMSRGAAAAIGGNSSAGAVGGNQNGLSGKVSVVSPQDGPDSILIANADTGFQGVSDSSESGVSVGGSSAASDGSQQYGIDEIRLDKKNGGVFSEKISAKTKWIIAGTVLVVGAAGGIGVFLFATRKRKRAGRRKKRPVRRKRKAAGKKRAKQAAKPATKKETVSGKRGSRQKSANGRRRK